MNRTDENPKPERAAARKLVIEKLGELREAIRGYRQIAHQPPQFLLEGVAPALPAEALRDVTVHPNRSALLADLPKGGRIAEVGTQAGNWAAEILRVVEPQELHLFDLSFRLLRSDVAGNPRVVQHQGDSARQLAALQDQYFDWIYIDGDHRYEGVCNDIAAAVQKVKAGGTLVFNDYTIWSPMEAMAYGVVRAVNELVVSGWRVVSLAMTPNGYWDVAVTRL